MGVGIIREVFQSFYKKWLVMKELPDRSLAVDAVIGGSASLEVEKE